ncbi:MAG: VOC family protein [Chitinophagaceae bacterium]
MAKLNPYLNFNKNCSEAMRFYQECLGGELVLQKVSEMPEMAKQMPPELKDNILHATLTSGDMVIMASDMNRSTPIEGNTFGICINCTSEAELNKFFSTLSAGGKVSQPPGDMPWGAKFADLTDKFGKNWMLNYYKNT